MFDTNDTNDHDIFGNRPSDVWGQTPGDVLGSPPADVWGNPVDLLDGSSVVDTLLDVLGGLFGG